MTVLAVVADFQRQMRIGSLEITAALAAVALLAARPRVRAAAEIGALSPMQVDLEILERGARRSYRGRTPFELGRAGDADVVAPRPGSRVAGTLASRASRASFTSKIWEAATGPF